LTEAETEHHQTGLLEISTNLRGRSGKIVESNVPLSASQERLTYRNVLQQDGVHCVEDILTTTSLHCYVTSPRSHLTTK
jgi:hypothetical protein